MCVSHASWAPSKLHSGVQAGRSLGMGGWLLCDVHAGRRVPCSPCTVSHPLHAPFHRLDAARPRQITQALNNSCCVGSSYSAFQAAPLPCVLVLWGTCVVGIHSTSCCSNVACHLAGLPLPWPQAPRIACTHQRSAVPYTEGQAGCDEQPREAETTTRQQEATLRTHQQPLALACCAPVGCHVLQHYSNISFQFEPA